jgi:hypothetical protein
VPKVDSTIRQQFLKTAASWSIHLLKARRASTTRTPTTSGRERHSDEEGAMTDQLEALRDSIISAVQQELTRHGQQVKAEVSRIHDELSEERDARTQLDGQLKALAVAMQRLQESGTGFQTELQRALEERLNEFGVATKRRHEEMDTRIGRVVEEANVGIASAVESASRPVMKQLEHRQEKVEGSISTLDQNLRKFDDQAARMVTHFNNVTTEIGGRMEELSRRVASDLDERVAALVTRVDEVAALAARQEAEVTSLMTSRVDQTEDRINDRIMSTEARLNDEIGTRVADIDAHLGRVSSGLDDTVTMLNERISAADAKFDEVEAQLVAVAESVKSVDAEAMEEMQEKVSSAAGEAMLVRIELERVQKSITEQLDKATVRVTEIETMVQEQHMDVETAVQLERLEEIERAVIALDPDQFVRKGDGSGGSGGSADRATDTAPETESDTMADAALALAARDNTERAAASSPTAPFAPPSADPTSSSATVPAGLPAS